MATPIDDFIPQIQPNVSGCPEDIVIEEIREACIRFCVDTWIIKETLPPADITIAVDDYTMAASANKDVVGITSFLYDKRELPRQTEEELDILDGGWRTSDPGIATAVTAPEPNRFLLNRKPEETIIGGLIVQIATRPNDIALEVDDLLFNEWRKAIKYGALQSICEIPGKGWSDMKLALWYGKRFNFQIQRAKARALMGHMRKSTAVKNRPWI